MIHRLADKIVEGKRKKVLKSAQRKKMKINEESNISSEDNLDKDGIINKEIESIRPITRDMQVIQTFIEDPFKREGTKNEIKAYEKDPFQETTDFDWSFDNPQRKCRLFTFKDLWNHNYLLSEGSKFGGDFLVSSCFLIVVFLVYVIIYFAIALIIMINDYARGLLWRPPHVSCQVHRDLPD